MKEITHFIKARHIDSYQKLRVLIFFHEHAESSWTRAQIAAQLYLGDGSLLEQIIADLQAAGLLNCFAKHCQLRDEVGVRSDLQDLIRMYENPLARQEILDGIDRHTLVSRR